MNSNIYFNVLNDLLSWPEKASLHNPLVDHERHIELCHRLWIGTRRLPLSVEQTILDGQQLGDAPKQLQLTRVHGFVPYWASLRWLPREELPFWHIMLSNHQPKPKLAKMGSKPNWLQFYCTNDELVQRWQHHSADHCQRHLLCCILTIRSLTLFCHHHNLGLKP